MCKTRSLSRPTKKWPIALISAMDSHPYCKVDWLPFPKWQNNLFSMGDTHKSPLNFQPSRLKTIKLIIPTDTTYAVFTKLTCTEIKPFP